MKNILKTLAINGCVLFLLAQNSFLSAQTPGDDAFSDPGAFAPEMGFGGQPIHPRAPTFERTSPVWKKMVKEVDFDGVPMSEVIVWLRTQFPEVNFIGADDVDAIPVKLQLRLVTLDDIFIALNITSKGELVANPMNEKMVSFFYRPMVGKPQAAKKHSRAYSIARYLTNRSDEEITKALHDLESALELTWKMLQKANPEDRNFQKPELNLHAPTKMLIAVGDLEQLSIIERFIGQLEGRPPSTYFPQPAQIPGRSVPSHPLLPPSTNQSPSTN